MNAGRGFAKDRHKNRVSRVSSRHLHIEGQFVGSDSLQDQLAGVGELPFIPFQRQCQQAEANGHRQQDEQDQACVPELRDFTKEKSAKRITVGPPPVKPPDGPPRPPVALIGFDWL